MIAKLVLQAIFSGPKKKHDSQRRDRILRFCLRTETGNFLHILGRYPCQITVVAEMITELIRFEPEICICIRNYLGICICNARFSAEIPTNLSP